jgi:hypothetical protein
VRTLTAHWQTTTVAQTTVAAQVHQSLDVQTDLTTKVTFNLDIEFLNHLADSTTFIVVQIITALIQRNLSGIENDARLVNTNSVDIGERNFHALISGKIDACDTSHYRTSRLPLPLVVAAVIANNPHDATSTDDFAFFTNLFNGCANFHE